MHHNLHGTGSHTGAALDTLLLIDHVNAGLGILSNGLMLACLHALAALDAYIGLGTAVSLANNLQAGQILMEFLVEGFGAGTDAGQTCHTLNVLFHRQLFHNNYLLFMFLSK